ncbi:type II secretion system protein N [Sphingomonas sp. Leaf17]|uniref:type II secretion system protein N n=1 Tax=Sphingomonas sp. Leaf17 TaxID=1735683 RepID=UPI0006FC26AE|nr:type II secretion system protein N [Sphingomonas sp. Leaf17]KQM63693.1 type II secretion system protein N [Sphingomonas sp. Leaf17]
MRRFRLRTGPGVLFGAMLAIALVVFLPMRLVLGWFDVADSGLVARRVSGTIWGATLAEARVGDLTIGDVSARLSPLALVVGEARLVLSRDGASPVSGSAVVSRHSVGLEDMTASIATGGLFAPVPVTTLDLDQVSVRFRDGQCDRAEGRVRATLAGSVAGIVVPTALVGTIRCDGTALLLPLTSQAGGEGVTVRIEGNGRYRADLTLAAADPLAAQRLEAAGLVAGNGGYRLSIEGRF